MSRAQKNNNLANYRKKQVEQNERLIRRAIAHIQSLFGEVTFSSVSKVTYDLADTKNGEKGISVAGITKNDLYRSLIEEAKNKQVSEPKRRSPKKGYSQADLQLMLHALRVENAQLKHENKTLALKLREIPDPVQLTEPIRDEIIHNSEQLKRIAKSITNRLQEVELAYIDKHTRSLMLAHFEEVLIPSEALELFYRKELDGLNN